MLLALSQVTRVVCRKGDSGITKLNLTGLGCCKIPFIPQPVVMRAMITYEQLYVLQCQPFVVLSWHVSTHLSGKNFSATSDETSKRRFQLEGVQRSLLTKTVLDAVCFVAIFQYFYYRLPT